MLLQSVWLARHAWELLLNSRLHRKSSRTYSRSHLVLACECVQEDRGILNLAPASSPAHCSSHCLVVQSHGERTEERREELQVQGHRSLKLEAPRNPFPFNSTVCLVGRLTVLEVAWSRPLKLKHASSDRLLSWALPLLL